MQNYCMNCMMPLGEENRPCPHCGYSGDGSVIAHQLRPGTLLNGRYLIGNAIGQGGFGITYIGRDTRLDMKIAVKEYYPTGYANRNSLVSPNITITDKDQLDFIEEGKKRFLQEARTLAKFNENVSVVNVHDFFEANQTAYIIMEYLDGQDLRQCLKQSLFTADQIFALMAPIFDALERIHGENMIHRDISPDNIMMLKNGTLKLMDFGATRQVNFSGPKSVSVVLKAGFAPEEQYRSKGAQGPWTDIYALCATIYKCITGITPDDSLQRGSKDEIQWPSERGFPITARQEAVLKKGMAVKQQNRFQSIGEMKAALNGGADSPAQTGGEPDDRTVYHPHISRKNADETDITQYHPHKHRGLEPPPGGKGGVKDGPAIRGPSGPPNPPGPQKPPETGSSGGGKRRFILAGVCAAAILLVVIAAAALLGGGDPVQEADPAGGPSADVTAEPAQELGVDVELDHSSMYHITLTVDDDVTVREFNKALPVLTERLNLLTGGEPYEMRVEDERIDLYIPRSAFGQVEIEQALKCYITRAADLYLFDKSSGSYLTLEKEALSRDDLESVVLMEGTLEGVDAAQYGIDTPTYQYVAVTLTDQCAQRCSQKIAAWDGNLAFAQDIDRAPDNYYYHYTFPAGDGKTFYILNNDLGGYFAELVVYNFTHDPLPYSFGIVIDLDSRVEWQSPEEASITGENQCEASELTGDTVTVLYKNYTKDLTAGELLDLETEMKTRLDILGQPYAYGQVEDEKYLILAVKTGPEHLGGPVIDLIVSNGSPYFRTNHVESYTNCDSFTVEKNPDGTYCAAMEMASYYANTLKRLTGWLEEQGGGTLSLTYGRGRMPLLDTDVGRQIEDGAVTFDRICFDRDGSNSAITDENVWILRLLEQVWTKSQSGVGLYTGDIQMNLAGKPTPPDESRYGVSYYQEVQDMTNAILSAAPDASVRVQDASVYVFLDLEINESLPETAAALGQDIYEASGFGTSVYSELIIRLIDEKDSAGERGRIIFSKQYKSVPFADENLTDGMDFVHGIFVNGRLERYQEGFKHIIETDAFYTGMTIDDPTSWIWSLNSNSG